MSKSSKRQGTILMKTHFHFAGKYENIKFSSVLNGIDLKQRYLSRDFCGIVP